MPLRFGIVMDPIATIKPDKDSSLAMLLAAQARGHALYYMELGDLYVHNGQAAASMRPLVVRDDRQHWYRLDPAQDTLLSTLDVILMRKDPPVDTAYLHATQILSLAERMGCLVANRPQALRDANEKLFATWFPEVCPPTLISSSPRRCREFLAEHGELVVKPLDAMGGASIFRLRSDDPNLTVILETMTAYGEVAVVAQRFLPEFTAGDKRILMIDGEPLPYALARIPAAGESRANLAAGGQGVGVMLGERDRQICSRVGPTLKALGIYFAGLDVIGDYLTEINVTSPTCIRELEREYRLDIAGQFIDFLQQRQQTMRT